MKLRPRKDTAENVKMTEKKSSARGVARFRILPVTLSLLGLMVLDKTVDVYFGMQSIQSAVAADESKKAHGEEADEKASDDHGDGHGDAHGDDGHGGGDKKKEDPPVTEGEGKTTLEEIQKIKEEQSQSRFSPIEVDILQNLKARREALDGREKEINLKLKVLDVAEQRLDDRIEEMRALQRELKITLTRYEDQQDEEIRGLVKIYESMRPSDAAVIFNELDLPILLSVVDKMSERKVAPVLAAMKPERAKEVTEELAELRKLRSLKSQRAKTLATGR